MLKVLNMIPEKRPMVLSIDGLPDATVKIPSLSETEGRTFAFEADPDKTEPMKVFVTLPPGKSAGESGEFRFILEDQPGHERDVVETTFTLPEAKK